MLHGRERKVSLSLSLSSLISLLRLSILATGGEEEGSRRERLTLSGGLHFHGALDEIQRAGDVVFREGPRDERPDLLQVLFSVSREEDLERRLLGKRPAQVVLGLEGLHVPVVDIVRVPGLLLLVCGRHCGDICAGVSGPLSFAIFVSSTSVRASENRFFSFLEEKVRSTRRLAVGLRS